ncbi:MAG: hypothetical protein JXR56_09165 [Candidatus Cloacimonetes bacterium]|nr:hypothetical protein [Candidatus Cloacimonadota bacterium]
MVYDLIIGTKEWFVQEENTHRIKKTDGFKYIEEALAHPEQSLPIANLYFQYFCIDDQSIGYTDWDQILNGDYIAKCYDEAYKERLNGYQLLLIYRNCKMKMEEKRKMLSSTELEYYESQMVAIKEVIEKYIKIDNNIDKFLVDTKHNAFQDICWAMKKIEKYAPILYAHLQKTLHIGYNLIYHPEEDSEFDLFIRESNEEQ